MYHRLTAICFSCALIPLCIPLLICTEGIILLIQSYTHVSHSIRDGICLLFGIEVALSVMPYRIEHERLAEEHLDFVVTPILSGQ